MRSDPLMKGPSRAPARAMLKATGLTDADLERPLIAVVGSYTDVMPCNLHLRPLAEEVKRGVRAAGGTPIEFNTIAVSDGVTMGSEGMRASLVSREVIADSIELGAVGHMVDGVGALGGCYKTLPAAARALARRDLPGLVFYGGPIQPGRFRGKDGTIQDVFEAVGAHARGAMTDSDLKQLEDAACPGAGACGGQFTANTMATALAVLGLAPIGAGEVPATSPDKPRVAREAGEMVMALVREARTARQFLPPSSLRNAIASIAATGGSPNGVLHMLAIAREAGLHLTISLFDRIAARTPVIADLKPGGRFAAADMYAAGGVGLLVRRMLAAGLLEDAPTVSGKTLRGEADAARETEGQQVIVRVEAPIKARGGFAILRGSLAPDGCVVKLAGHERELHEGPARVYDGVEAPVSEARRLTGAEILWEALVAEGVEVVFGYPGGAIMPAYDAMLKYADRIRHVLVRHEQGAAHMADGYARASGKVGVALATSGPGATNLVTGIATAMMDSVPVEIISGQVSSKVLGTDAFQEIDITGITLPITKHNFLVTRAEDIAATVREAFQIALSGRPGPVLVDITPDAQPASALFAF